MGWSLPQAQALRLLGAGALQKMVDSIIFAFVLFRKKIEFLIYLSVILQMELSEVAS